MKELEFTTYVKRPEMLEKSVQACVPHWTINIDSRQIENELGILVYKQEVVRLEGELTYEKIVAAIINAKYSPDDQTAILMNAINPNYLTEERKQPIINGDEGLSGMAGQGERNCLYYNKGTSVLRNTGYHFD